MSRLENHVMLRDAATDVFSMLCWRNVAWPQLRELFLLWKTDFLGNCSMAPLKGWSFSPLGH